MKTYIVIGLFLFTSIAIAKNEHEAEAERLLELTGAKTSMTTMADMLLAQQLEQNPELVPLEGALTRFLRKHLSYEALKADLISVYVQAFTKDELIAINDFYSTDVGRKAVRLMPVMMRRLGDIGLKRVQDNMGELEEMIQKEEDRLKSEREEQPGES